MLLHCFLSSVDVDKWLTQYKTGSAIYHGPSSIYSTALWSSSAARSTRRSNSPTIFESRNLRGPVIHECLALCFRWQHFCTMIVDQDAFLKDFLSNPHTGVNCSPSLVYALCGLGALMSSDSKIRGFANQFSVLAQDALTSAGSWVPHTTSIQALLCCALFEFGQNKVSKGWMYSGMLDMLALL